MNSSTCPLQCGYFGLLLDKYVLCHEPSHIVYWFNQHPYILGVRWPGIFSITSTCIGFIQSPWFMSIWPMYETLVIFSLSLSTFRRRLCSKHILVMIFICLLIYVATSCDQEISRMTSVPTNLSTRWFMVQCHTPNAELKWHPQPMVPTESCFDTSAYGSLIQRNLPKPILGI